MDEIVGGVTQRRENEVQLLPVVAALSERGLRLDEQGPAVGVLAAICRWLELVGEESQGSVVARHHTHRNAPSRRDSGSRGGLR